jgi:hypothetical protein
VSSTAEDAASTVEEAWAIAHRAGVPLAGARAGVAPSAGSIARAIRSLVLAPTAPQLSGREREALGAFLLAWSDHFRRSYETSFGIDASRLSEWAESVTPDANRRIKLRRIALESLATVL